MPHSLIFFLPKRFISQVNQSTTESAHTIFGEVVQAILSLVILDRIQSQPVNQKKRTHIFQDAANRYVNWWKATTV